MKGKFRSGNVVYFKMLLIALTSFSGVAKFYTPINGNAK